MKYFVLIFLALSSVAYGEQVSKRTVTGISVYDTYVVISVSPNIANTDSCTKSNAADHIILLLNSDGAKAMYSTILSAKVSGTSVGFGLSGCQGWGGGTVAKIYRVDY